MKQDKNKKNIEQTLDNQKTFFSEETEYVTSKKDTANDSGVNNRFRRGVLLNDAKKYPQIFSDYLNSCTAYVCNDMVVYPPLVISVRVGTEDNNMSGIDNEMRERLKKYSTDSKTILDELVPKDKKKVRENLPNIPSKLKEKNKKEKNGEDLFLVENYQDLPQVSVNIELTRAKTVSEKIAYDDNSAQELLNKYLGT
ncbi:MAG: hypothetical protein FWE22_01125 [Firmicutes bacterium]|nr:hypothetical protein [Bacillota bacterium]